MCTIKFITDSASDIPQSLREELNIHLLPFPIAMGGEEFEDGNMAPQEFYKLLVSLPQIPTHAQLNPYLFEQTFRQAYEEGCTDLIYTSINSKASSTHQNALQAREEFYEDHPESKGKFNIRIIDSLTYTMGYGWAVVEGARMAKNGSSPDEIEAFIRDWTEHVGILFVPFDLKFAKKSGRISAAAAFVGEALGLKPIMTFEDGQSKVLTKVRGEKNVIPTMLQLCKENREENSPYMIIRADLPDQADLLAQTCTREFGCAPALDYCIGAIIAINAGPNLIGLVYRKK